jgi:LmbE family N-acetylglucosaminyl deacetylase
MSAPCDITPEDLMSRRILIVAPHMDDEVLGCGGLMLMHEDKTNIHCVYATDGARSPTPLLPWTDSINPDIKALRRQEARDVMSNIGVPRENVVFLDFPDGKLSRCNRALKFRLIDEISRIEPAVVLAPFRYDLHADHVAVNLSVRAAVSDIRIECPMLEYIIYFRWQLLESGDVRRTIRESNLLKVDTTSVAEKKSALIGLYRSQTEILSDWQEQPILTSRSIAERCSEPESFVCSDPGQTATSIFTGKRLRHLAAHYIERIGKRPKDQILAFVKWLGGFTQKQDE